MAFGSIMRVTVGDMTVELAPLNREVMGEFIKPGMQSAHVTKYLVTQAKVLEDEYEWYDKVRTDSTSITWGVWVVNGDSRELIGTSSLHHVERDLFYMAGSGSLLFKREYWGKGIASVIHQARTWYAFQIVGIDRIWSEVLQGNVASRRALEKSGYYVTHVKRNDKFVDGKLRHVDVLECINPNTFTRWWDSDRTHKSARDARGCATAAMLWASKNVTLV